MLILFLLLISWSPQPSLKPAAAYCLPPHGHARHRFILTTPFEHFIEAAAKANHLDPRLLRAVIYAESQFNAHEVSPAGACGLMQLMPKTARLLSVKDIFDPEQNIMGGARHLRYLLNRFSNDLMLSLAAYNAGELPVLRSHGIPPYPETQHYVTKVLRLYRTYTT